MATPEQFAASMLRLAARVEKRGPEIQRKLAGAILQAVVFGTPVGNPTLWREPQKARAGYVGGRARANWLVALGAPRTEQIDAADSGGSATVANGKSIIDGHKTGDIHLTNNLPYIKALNDGHSHQAPAGFIEAAIKTAENAIQGDKVTEEGR